MKLVWSTEDFKIAGESVSGFPLLLDRDGRLERIAHLFLIDNLLEQGGNPSRSTWRFYGYALFGFFSYLEDQQRQWNEARVLGRASVLASYRSYFSRRAKRSTVNGRLDALVRLYEFAERNRLIAELPFAYKEAEQPTSHDNRVGSRFVKRKTKVDGLRLRNRKNLLKVLSAQQCQLFIASLSNRTHFLMAQLQLTTGLRVDELVSFPKELVIDPRSAPNVRAFFPVVLRPSEMRTKGSVERTVHIPRELMASLWGYKAVDRTLRLQSTGNKPSELFVTERGKAFETRSVWKIYKEASGRLGFDVHPHILRHTYATHTIRCLSRKINVGNALLYVRDRLGHASVLSTEIYLHYADDLVITVMDDFQNELTELAKLTLPS